MEPVTQDTSLNDGDIVLVDFEAWTDEGDLFDTTRKEVAEKAGWDTELPLKPMPVLIGGGRVVPGFEEALRAAEKGDEAETEVPPEKAFGTHDPNLVRLFPRHDFEKREMEPELGMRVEVGGRKGTVTQVTASRVRVDFNHPYAGRTLSYKYKVEDVIDSDQGRVEALIGIDYSVIRGDDFDVTIEGNKARVVVPEEAQLDSNWFMAKHRLGHDLFDHTELDEVTFVETMTRKQMEAHGHGHGGVHAHTHDHEHDHEHDHDHAGDDADSGDDEDVATGADEEE